MLELRQRVLAGAGVEHQQHFVRGIGAGFADHAPDFFQLVHQSFLGVLSPGGVHDEHVAVARDRGIERIVHHGRRIGAGVLGDDGDVEPPGPGLELLDGRGAEGVGRRQCQRQAPVFEVIRQLGNGGGLAHAVDPHDHDDERFLRRDFQPPVAGTENGKHALSQRIVHGARVFQLLA